MLELHLFRHCHPSPAAPDAQPPGPSRRWRHRWQPRQAPGSGRLCAKSTLPPPFSAPTLTPQPPHAPCIEPTPPEFQPRQPPCLATSAPLAGLLPAPSEPRNRSPRTQGPSPARARPAPAGGWPEFGRIAAGRRPGTTPAPKDHIARKEIFPRASPRKGNSNSKSALAVSCKLRRKS
jgi:hypothetical protein